MDDDYEARFNKYVARITEDCEAMKAKGHLTMEVPFNGIGRTLMKACEQVCQEKGWKLSTKEVWGGAGHPYYETWVVITF